MEGRRSQASHKHSTQKHTHTNLQSGADDGPLPLTLENVEMVLDEMRPYLMSDGWVVCLCSCCRSVGAWRRHWIARRVRIPCRRMSGSPLHGLVY